LRKYSIDDLQLLASERGGKCLSGKYINGKYKYAWICHNGHDFQAAWDNVQRGHWCPICGNARQLSIKEMQEHARRKGGKCISKKYINNYTKLQWECVHGHQWEATPSSIKRGRWCPECFRVSCGVKQKKTHSIEEFKEIAKNHGGECLSSAVCTTIDRLKFRCSKNHIWETRANSVLYDNSWCPICSRGFNKSKWKEAKNSRKS